MRQRMNTVAMVAAILAVLLLIVSPVGATAAYSDPQGQFSFMLPDRFTSVANPRHAAAFLLNADPVNKAAGNFVTDIIPGDAATGAPTLQLIDAQNNPIPPAFDQPITLGGQLAHRSDFVIANGGIYRVIVAARKDAQIYWLVFDTAPASFNDYAPLLQTILTSFAFGGTPNAASSG